MFKGTTHLSPEAPMRLPYTTVTPRVVHTLAATALRTLDLTAARGLTAGQLLDLLLRMAATARTLFAVVRGCCSVSYESARRAVRANLPTTDQLTARLADALVAVAAFSARDRRRRWTVAIDLHYVPYYGDRTVPGVVGGPKTGGTKHFFAYATAVLLHRRRRYTVGLVPMTTPQKPHELVRALLDQVTARHLRVGGVVLDAGFDSGQTLLLLQARDVSYVVPLRRNGNTTNRRNAWFGLPHGTVQSVTWTTEKTRQAVTTAVVVWRGPGEPRARVFAFRGWGVGSAVVRARVARQRYRMRFGIETSYRQKNQARAWTTAHSTAYRLLLEGVAQVIRQVWVNLTHVIAAARGLGEKVWVGELPLWRVLDWLRAALESSAEDVLEIPLGPPDATPAAG